MAEVQTWFNVLMPKVVKYMYGNGGPIIMVQVSRIRIRNIVST